MPSRANKESDGIRLRRAPLAWQEPAIALVVILAAAGCLLYYTFSYLPNQKRLALDEEISALEARFGQKDLLWADRMARELKASNRVQDKGQLARLDILLARISEARARYRCSVTFSVTPSTAIATLVDGRRIESHATLPPGEYTVEFKTAGYQTEKRTCTLEADLQIAAFGDIHLSRLRGSLKVNLEDPEVRFSIIQIKSDDDKTAEFTSIENGQKSLNERVPTGIYRITWTEDGVNLGVDEVKVSEGAETYVQKNFGTSSVVIDSDPPGATLWIEGEKGSRGLLPQTIRLRPVKYRMKAQYEDWPLITKDIQIPPGRESNINFVWDYANLDFVSDPPKARVYSGAEEIGITPFSKVMLAGNHHFVAKLVNLDECLIDIVLRKNHAGKINFAFHYGTLVVESEPSGAELVLPKIPRDPRRITPYPLKVRPGPVTLRVELPGYQPVTISHTILLDKVSTIKTTLERN